jgi:hypothetical protein
MTHYLSPKRYNPDDRTLVQNHHHSRRRGGLCGLFAAADVASAKETDFGRELMKQFFDLCLQMKRSIMAFVVTLILGLFSMGALGLALYYPVYPVLAPFFGDPNDWHGDWVWPSVIGAGMAWSFSFLVAGLLNRRLEQARWQARYRKAIYVAVLWLGAALIWLIILSANI